MKVLSATCPTPTAPDTAAVEIMLSAEHTAFLERLRQEIGPDMPVAFGWPHAIRTILERIEESGIDLTDASSEEEIARLVAGKLRVATGRRTKPATAASYAALAPTRSEARPVYRSSQPATDRFRFGKRPRSSRG